MAPYHFILLSLVLASSFLVVRYFLFRKQSSALLLFINATRSENNGDYLEAASAYENALSELKKSKFHSDLKLRIIEKLKLMQTLQSYKIGQSFVRTDDSWIK